MNYTEPLTVADLWHYAAGQATISRTDYFDPCNARLDELAAWGHDVARRNSARRLILRTFPERASSTEPLTPGNYYGGRLRITPDSIDYTPGQYAPLEVYPALFDYFTTTETNANQTRQYGAPVFWRPLALPLKSQELQR